MQEKIDRYIKREIESAKALISSKKELPAHIHYLMEDAEGKLLAHKEDVRHFLGDDSLGRYKMLGTAHSFSYRQFAKGKDTICVILISDAWIRWENIDPGMTDEEVVRKYRKSGRVSQHPDKTETILCSISYRTYNTCVMVPYQWEEQKPIFGEIKYDDDDIKRAGLFAELFAPLLKTGITAGEAQKLPPPPQDIQEMDAMYFFMDMSNFHDRSKTGAQDIFLKNGKPDFEPGSALSVALLLSDGKKIIGFEFRGQCEECDPYISYVEGMMDHIVVFHTMPKDDVDLRQRLIDFLAQVYNYNGKEKINLVLNPKNEARYGNSIKTR